jgi:hypothetical protein
VTTELSGAIDALAMEMLIVDSTGTNLHLNTAAERLLNNRADDLGDCKVGRLTINHPIDKNRLSALITDATGNPAVGGTMFLSGAKTQQAIDTPLPAASPFAQDWQTSLALILVMEASKTLTPL